MPSEKQVTQKMIIHQYDFLTASYKYISAKINYYTPITTKQIISFSLYGQIVSNIKQNKEIGITLSILF